MPLSSQYAFKAIVSLHNSAVHFLIFLNVVCYLVTESRPALCNSILVQPTRLFCPWDLYRRECWHGSPLPPSVYFWIISHYICNRNGDPLHYSCILQYSESHRKGNLVGKVHGVAKSQIWLSNSHFHFQAIEGHFGCFQFSSIMNKAVRRSKKSSKRIQLKEIASRILWHSGCRTWEKQEGHVRCQFFLSHWKSGLPTYWNREDCGIWLGKIKFKNMIWELVDLDCYLDIHLDIPSWQLDYIKVKFKKDLKSTFKLENCQHMYTI